jgi:hypothetical protein
VPSTGDVDILVYQTYADAAAVAEVDAIVRYSTANKITAAASDADVANLTFGTSAGQYSVLLVLDQPGSLGVDFTALGASWAKAISAFAQAGGVVIFLDGGTGADQMPALVTATGVLTVDSPDLPLPSGPTLSVLPTGDVLAVGVTNPYAPLGNSVAVTTDPNGENVSYVVAPSADASMTPVVVHKVY